MTILNFMKKKVIIPGLITAGVAAFLSFKMASNSPETDKVEQVSILSTVMQVINRGHYAPKPLDDSLSNKAFTAFFENLDFEKKFFYAKDIESLEKYRYQIDDQVKVESLEFFEQANALFIKRVQESEAFYKKILAKPFTFDANDSLNIDGKKVDYVKNEKEMEERWYAHLKYRTLAKYYDLKETEEKKAKDSTGYKMRDFATLEKESREAIEKVQERYFKRLMKLNTNDRFAVYINSITGTIDPHTDYMLPSDKKRFDEMMSGGFIGIGAALQETDEGGVKISSLIPGSPAKKAGKLKVEDHILKVGQGNEVPVDIMGYALEDVIKLIRGKKGTEVRLTVKHQDGTTEVVSLVRDQISNEEAFAKSAIINKDNKKVGYIYLPDFYADFSNQNTGRRSGEDVKKEVEKLKHEGVDGIILDLRNNGGGSLTDCVEMSGIFLGPGPVVQVRSSGNRVTPMASRATEALYSGPLAIMVNVGSASASEILAAVMQDYKRAVVVGATSFGKGTVQNIVPLDNFVDSRLAQQILNAFNKAKNGETDYDGIGSLKLTISKFYRVDGGSTQLKGVTPDILLPDAYAALDNIGERKDPASLPWDKIKAANYKLWPVQPAYATLKQNSEARVSKDKTFDLIKQTSEKLKAKNENNYVPLSFEAYNKYVKEMKKINDEIEELEKTQPHHIDIKVLNVDAKAQASDTAAVNKNKEWIKNLQKDVYIYETTNIINDMISSK